MERGSRLGVFSLCMSCQRLLPVRFGTAPHVVTHMNAPFRSYSLWYEQREGRGQDALASPLRTKQNNQDNCQCFPTGRAGFNVVCAAPAKA